MRGCDSQQGRWQEELGREREEKGDVTGARKSLEYSSTLGDRTKGDRRRLPDLGHPSTGDEPRRNAIADEDPNTFAAPTRRRPRSDDHSPQDYDVVEEPEYYLEMSVYQVHNFCCHFEGFVRELRMMVTFLGFFFEHEFHGVYMEEFAGPCDVSLTIHGFGEHLPFFTAALGGPTFDVACQRVALQALMELRMIYDDRLQNMSFRLVPKRTPGAHRSIYIGVHSDRDPVMARQTRLLQAMDDLHTEAVLDAEEHHEAVEFLC
ncbi:hypothetical protein GUJ93_ZPchr0008g11511 [Zizania palustris]|uniref:Uncharacterized protein n=1 Tax=Zizania palustris TaxID=103762 RepID=A0A8J5RXA2_ZIZPA|nr:hypothetical protein GUJ93_ZPchr0008g11511 [Zizania palustris]